MLAHTQRVFFCLLFFAVSFVFVCPLKAEDYGTFEGVEYVDCYDGDTCRFNIPQVHPLIGRNISVRLDGIDTPEISGKCAREKRLAREAKRFINQLFQSLEANDRIDLVDLDRGKYFRVVATIHLIKDSGRQLVDVNHLMIQKGLAVPYSGKSRRRSWCREDGAKLSTASF